jgi:hypothetical protein
MTATPIFETLQAFFAEDDWAYTPIEAQSLLRIDFQGENGQWICLAQAREAQEQFIFYSICPNTVPPNKRLVMAEFLTRANCGLVVGNFELDFEDGAIRYKTSIDVEDTQLNAALIRHLVYVNVLTMDKYLPSLAALIYTDVSAAEAMAQVED